ncbi:MAG: HAMP domain-containing protein [Acidobacteria bacterium]|nr:MAG: HAMP domain-containing protein [Acidobacteriota bacterium]
MKALFRYSLLVLAVLLFALVVIDLRALFQYLVATTAWSLLALAVVGLVGAKRAWPNRATARTVAVLLFLGALSALLVRMLGYERAATRSVAAWESGRESEGERIARKVSSEFEAICATAQRAARELAHSSELALAVEGSDAEDYLSRAFEALEKFSLPRAHPLGAPGATLYDVWHRPIAWSGENISLGPVLEQPYGVLDADIFILEQGVYTFIVAVEPLQSRLGFVSVEIPLIADRRLQNRYLEDYDALSTWLGRSVDTAFVYFGGRGRELAELLQTRGDPFWGGPEDAPRLYLGLESKSGGKLLGVASVAAEAPILAQLDASRRFESAASIALVLAALLVLATIARARVAPVLVVFTIWAVRLVILWSGVPLSFGFDLDNPAHYASSLFFNLTGSPIDFLLTTAALLASVVLLARYLRSSGKREKFRLAYALAAAVASVVIFLGANQVILDAWMNSNFALSTVDLTQDAPRFVVQLGLVLMFLAAVLTSFVLTSAVSAGNARAIVSDLVVLASALVLLAPYGLADHVLLAIFPLVVVRLLALRWDQLSEQWPEGSLYFRLATIGLWVLLAVLAFFPSIARFEELTIKSFIESTVTPVLLQHGPSADYAVVEATRAIDRMQAEGRLEDLDREDIAYRIWVTTGLGMSSASSSIEIVDGDGELVSHFALSFPVEHETTRYGPAGEQWALVQEDHPNGPKHPRTLLARRAANGPHGRRWEIRVRLAADWRNLPFISTSNPYLFLFRTSGVEARFRFPYRELALFVFESDGTVVFQSTAGVLEPPESVLEDARRAPLWREHESEGQRHQSYFVSNGLRIFALSYPKTSRVTYAAQLAGWALLVVGVLAAALVAAVVLAMLGSAKGVSPAELWAGIGTSFYGKLYVAFVLIALVPIASLAFLIRGLLVGQLERDVEQEGLSRALVIQRFVDDFVRSASDDGLELSNAVLERIGGLAGVDVDLYLRGELVATSKPELFGSGLLRSRAAPSAYRDLVLERQRRSIHREYVGSFSYVVVSVPLELPMRPEPGILSVPLASRDAEIERRVTSLNHTLLLAALCFSIAAALLAYTLARRIAGPINSLTEATRHIAGGDLDVSLETTSQDEIGALFSSFIQMTADLKQQRSDLEKTKKLEAWAEMARQVAHEIKNPLTPIQLATEHLLRVHKDPGVDFEKVLDECTETILQQVRSLRQISMEFSTFASPEPLKREPTDIEALVREAITPYVTTPPDGVTVKLEIASTLPQLEVDARLLKRTLLNLVENALHALNGEGDVAIHVTSKRLNGNGFVEIIVTDTGVGVEPELRERIFEPYFSTRAAGTGLGLAIAKKVVEDHGGTITLESERGQGTSVRMLLPSVIQ